MFVDEHRRTSTNRSLPQGQPTTNNDEHRRTTTNIDEQYFFSPPRRTSTNILFVCTLCLGGPTQPFLAGTQRTKNSFLNFWPSPRQLRVKNTLRVGHRGPVGRKTTQKPPQNTKKWKKIVKKRLFSGFGHVGQNSDFSRKKPKNGTFFDITKPPLAQIYPKSGL